MSVDSIPSGNQRQLRAAIQYLLARELNEAMLACLKQDLCMPLACLLRSLIDTTALGLWLLKYAPEDQLTHSVAHLSTTHLVRESFDTEDQEMFAFIFKTVKNTDHEFYRDVLHPSVHGDALHIAMRLRDETSKNSWICTCSFYAENVYRHFLCEFDRNSRVPDYMKEEIKLEIHKCTRRRLALLKRPEFEGMFRYS